MACLRRDGQVTVLEGNLTEVGKKRDCAVTKARRRREHGVRES